MNTKLFANTLLFGLAVLGAGGCYTTKIHTAAARGPASITHQERWHHTLVAGLAEISDPVDLEAACPGGGWTSIDEEYTFLNGLVAGLTGGIYTPRTYTVNCGAGAPGGASPWAPGAPGGASPWTPGAPTVGTPPAPPK